MKFVFNMAYREMRASWHRLMLFFLCIAIGVGSIIGVRSLLQNLNAAVTREARTLFMADVQVVREGAAWTSEMRAVLDRNAGSPIVTGHADLIRCMAMAMPVNDPAAAPVQVQLGAVTEQFPLYGEFVLSSGQPYSHGLLKNRGLLAQPSLLAKLNAQVGDEVIIGRLTFVIRDVFEKQFGNPLNQYPAPQVLVDYDDSIVNQLATFGTRAGYLALFRVREGTDTALVDQLRADFNLPPLSEAQQESRPRPPSSPQAPWVGSARDSQDWLSRILLRVENNLSLVGLTILVLGGIGVSSVTRVFIQQKMRTIAILKCLGGKNRRVLGAYLSQVLVLGVAGSLLGLGLARVITAVGPRYFIQRLPFEIEFGLTWQASLQGVGIGVLVALLFSLMPLLEIRTIKPALLLRNETASVQRRVDWQRYGAGLIVLLGLLSLAAWQAGSVKVGGILLGGLVATGLILHLAATALIRSLRGLRRFKSFVLSQGVNSLHRAGNQTRVILLAVGLGAFFVVAIRVLQENLLTDFNLDLKSLPDLYLIDIQKGQRDAVQSEIERVTGITPRVIPVLQPAVMGLTRSPDNSSRVPDSQIQRRLLGRRSVTYRYHLEPSETIVKGKLWEATPGSEPEVSVEEGIARDVKLEIGDELIFEIDGRNVAARVTSIRHTGRTGPVAPFSWFAFVFRPGTLDDAPQMLVATMKAPQGKTERAQFQREIIAKFPNIWVFDAFDVMESVETRLNDISLAVTLAGAFVLLCGVLILTGSIAMTKINRVYEAAILKTLGAKRKLIVCITLIEYGVLGLLAGLIGSAGAIGLSWASSKYILQMDWEPALAVNVIGVAGTAALVTIVGLLSSWDVMTRKPLGILRSEA
jgi:putative ABC transport system permease protein